MTTLPTIRPMLASPSTKAGGRKAVDLATLVGSHTFDLKLDGLRAVLYWDGDTMRLVNRSGVDITRKFPDVEAVGPALGRIPVILDGELVCDSGLFNDVATRGKQEKPAAIADAVRRLPARFIAFDLLHLGGSDYLREPYSHRRGTLEQYVAAVNDPLITASIVSDDGLTFWQSVSDLGLEGLIAKDKTAPYMEAKRSPAWLKFKTVRRITCIMSGYEPGEGARAHFGAGFLCLLDAQSQPVPVGKVGTGFTESEIQHLKASLDAGTPVLVEIEALNVGSGGQLRFPVYKGVRTDLSYADATLDQLDTLPRA